jgi:hypothetical protein
MAVGIAWGGRCRPGVGVRRPSARWPVLDVVGAEAVEQRLELPDGGGAGLVVEPFLHRLVEALHFPACLRVMRPGMVEPDAAGMAGDLEGDPAAAPRCAGERRPLSDNRVAGSLVAAVKTVLT